MPYAGMGVEGDIQARTPAMYPVRPASAGLRSGRAKKKGGTWSQIQRRAVLGT